VAPKGRASETSRTKVLVIGAGQAGLAASHELKRAGIGFLLIDAGSVIGDSWRKRYDTLTLFSPRSISSLKGMSLPGDPEGYATKDEFADYLAEYAVKDGHGAIMATRIASLRKIDETFEATTTDRRTFIADAVIVAAGAFQSPRIPTISSSLSPHVQQIHVANFQTASSVKDGPVLVVGDGASGRDVAAALASKHVVALCPDVCPTTLFELTDLMTELGATADRFNVAFITVDPERDTSEMLAGYMASFDTRIMALRGNPEQTQTAVKAFAAYARKVPTDGGNYTMDHTAGVYLMDADGDFKGTLDMHEPREVRLQKIRNLLNSRN